ncbi:MAG: arylsulfatase [Kiritimatiellales bacterium]|nr:arylsulfatase [Kiritimatiellales bacterium]MCF7864643.1 arylsulfatase [Kiritimatiellales bacterium]
MKIQGTVKSMIVLLCLSIAFWCGKSHAADAPKPNILVVLVDDLGFSDIGCYGSEIDTPNLDRLAKEGLRFTQFYNTAKCHSSRVSLMSGRWCREAGDVKLTRATIIPEVLAPAGYFTAMTGKWHLDKQPTDFGFERYFGHLSGATDYYKGNNTFRLNGEPWTVPEKGFYTTVANVDYAIRFLGEARETKKPWFLYVAFNAPHAPLQPLEADYKKYLGRYDVGWDVMRAARVEKQKELGLFGAAGIEASPRPDHIPAWNSLTPEMQNWESRRMAAYAGLIDRVDQELGRLFADLKRVGELDNTLILFVSDNGACPYDRRSIGRDLEPYDPEASWSDSTGWAWARNTPFRYYKQNQFEGGISTPAIVHWPAGLKTKPGSLVDSPAHLVDVLPTLAEIGGATIPDTWPGRDLSPLAGISLVPILAGKEIKSRPPIHLLFASDRGLRDGDWKLVSFQSGPWELYKMGQDRTELHNVAAQYPEVVDRMEKQWIDMAENVLRAPAKEYAPVSATAPLRHREWTDFSSLDASTARHDAAKDAKKKKKPTKNKPGKADDGIRARIGTTLSVQDDQLVLQCTGDDPGLAFNAAFPPKSKGPYTLEFRLQSHAVGDGEIYWTNDEKTILPKGSHLAFPVKHDGEWQTVVLNIPEIQSLYSLRLDPCGGPGEVRIDGLKLKDAAGEILKSWP